MNEKQIPKLIAKYKYNPPYLDVMTIGPKGLTGGHGEEDEITPEIDWTTTPEGKFLFAEIYDWSTYPPALKEKIPHRISQVMGWDLFLLQKLIEKAENNPTLC